MSRDCDAKLRVGQSTRRCGMKLLSLLSLSDRVLIRVFVDSVTLHRFWHCHRRPERSFFVRGRQFHICARCTGVLTGLIACPSVIPIRSLLPVVFFVSAAVLIIDSFTQLVGWRESNNGIRFATGLVVGLTAGPTCFALGGL